LDARADDAAHFKRRFLKRPRFNTPSQQTYQTAASTTFDLFWPIALYESKADDSFKAQFVEVRIGAPARN
jgi:hypothetical protein